MDVTSESKDKSNTHFFFSAEPQLAIEFKTESKLAYRFGLTYKKINWNRTIDQLDFNYAEYQTPHHKTATLFFSGGFVF